MISRRKLTQREATARAAAVTVAHYDITLDLSEAVEASTFLGQTVVRFSCRDTAASTVIDVAAQALRSVVLNGVPVDLPAWSRETGRLTLSGLAPDNVLRIEGDFVYSTTGQGLHRLVDPTDGQTYLYTQLCVDNAPLVFACFDQPDLKAEFTWHVTVPTGWLAVSNMPVEACPDSVQVGFPRGRVQPEQHRPRRSAPMLPPVVAVEFVDQDGECFGTGVVLQIEGNGPVAFAPHAQRVGEHDEVGVHPGWAEAPQFLVRPPQQQPPAAVLAFVSGQVGEELVDTEAMVAVAAGGDAMQPHLARRPPRRVSLLDATTSVPRWARA